METENLPMISGLGFFQLLTALLKEAQVQSLGNADIVSNQANSLNIK